MSHAGHHSVATENDLPMMSAALTEDGMSEAEAVTQVATIMYVRNFTCGDLYTPILNQMLAKCAPTLKSSGYEAVRLLAEIQTPPQLWSAMALTGTVIASGILYGVFDATGYSHVRGEPIRSMDALYIPVISTADPQCPCITLRPWTPSCTLVAAVGADGMGALRSLASRIQPYAAAESIPSIMEPTMYGWRWLAGIALSNQWRSVGFIAILAMVDLLNQVIPPPTPISLLRERMGMAALATTLATMQQQYLLQGTAYLEQRAGFSGARNSRVGWHNPGRIITIVNGRVRPCKRSLFILREILSTLNVQPKARYKNDIAYAIARAIIRVIRDLSPQHTYLEQLMGYNRNYSIETTVRWWDLNEDGEDAKSATRCVSLETMVGVNHHMAALELPFWDAFAALEAEQDEKDPDAEDPDKEAADPTAAPTEAPATAPAEAQDPAATPETPPPAEAGKSDDMTEKSTDAADTPNEGGASADWSQAAPPGPGGSDTTEDDVIDQAKASMLLGKEEQSKADAYLYKRAFLAYVNRAIENGTISAEKASLLSTWTKAWLFLSPVDASKRLLRALGLRLPSAPI